MPHITTPQNGAQPISEWTPLGAVEVWYHGIPGRFTWGGGKCWRVPSSQEVVVAGSPEQGTPKGGIFGVTEYFDDEYGQTYYRVKGGDHIVNGTQTFVRFYVQIL